MNVFEYLAQEHDQARQVMEQLTEQPRQDVFDQLMSALRQHIGGEEQVVYPALDGYIELHDHVQESMEAHRVVRRLLNEVAALDPADDTWVARFHVLRESVEHHLREEQETVFPKAQGLLEARTIEDLGARYAEERGLAT